MQRHLKITCQIVGEDGQTLSAPFTSFGVSVELPAGVQVIHSTAAFEELGRAAAAIARESTS